MLNLGAIVNAVGQRITMVQQRDTTAMTTFAQVRHDQLYRAFLWRDSIIMFTLPIDTSTANYVVTNNYMPTKGNLILPPIFEHVVAVRTSDHKLNIERPMVYFRVDFDNFKQTGLPSEYFLLGAAAWEFDTVQAVVVNCVNAADVNVLSTFDVQDADTIDIDRVQPALSLAGTAVATTDVVYGMQKPATQGIVQMLVGATVIKTMQATDTDVPKCQRLRLMTKPNMNTTLRVLGKRTPPPFAANSDVPGVNGLDAILIPLVYYDMLHRDERGGTPESDKAMIEAVGPRFLIDGTPGGFLGKLIEEEVVQAAQNTRVMPEFGFGDDSQYGWATPFTKGDFV
jgi:hypothetical protein